MVTQERYPDLMRDHKSLKAWQEARVVALGVVEISRDHWRPWASVLFAQVQRSALSVQLNISEGYAYGDSPTFTHFLQIAYGSALETGDALDGLVDSGALTPDIAAPLQRANLASRMLLLGLLKRRNVKGF
jgi:four helix bundle protein